ncbi:MAG: hypothetical protein HZC41_17375 [Chloroflexi bacterium]|nr:hypothetical protein [Chloroflexota bacterium]
MAEVQPPVTETQSAPRAKRSPLRRIGCGLGLLLWAVVMVSPCLLFTLATQGQITVMLGGAPNQEARIWLINEARVRGIAISWPSLHNVEGDTALCVQTDTRFFLWAGSGDPATFCECYTRIGPDDAWTAAESFSGSCQP